jgi:hypothetical protein
VAPFTLKNTAKTSLSSFSLPPLKTLGPAALAVIVVVVTTVLARIEQPRNVTPAFVRSRPDLRPSRIDELPQ